MTTYLDIVPNSRIVTSEPVEEDGSTIFITMNTTTLEPHGERTRVTLTAQVVSLIGSDAIEGVRNGNNAALDNLVRAVNGATVS